MSYTPNIESRIIIKRAEQFNTVLRSDVTYHIDGSIDMGTISIKLPNDGPLSITAGGFFVSKLYSTEDNYTMFANPDSGNPSDFNIEGVELSVSGANSKLFDVDNDGNNASFEFINCNIGSFSRLTTSFGNVDNYRQVRFLGCGFINYSDGLTFNGTFAGGLAVTDSILLSAQAGSSLFKEGLALSIQGRSISNVNASSGSNASNIIVWDFQESNIQNDSGFQLDGASFTNLTDPIPNLSETSTKSFFKDCVNIKNTRAGFEAEFTAQVLTPLTVNTEAKVLGTTVISNNTWWSQTANNEWTYNSDQLRTFRVTVNVVVDAGPNDELAVIVRQWDNSASAYVQLKYKLRTVNNVGGGLDIQDYNFVTSGVFEINDRIELWMENTTDGTDATVQISSDIFVDVIL